MTTEEEEEDKKVLSSGDADVENHSKDDEASSTQNEDKPKSHPLLHLMGPAYAREKQFWIAICYSSIPQGLFLGLVALALFNVIDQLSKVTWLTHEYELALESLPSDVALAQAEEAGDEEHHESGDINILRIGQGEWWYVGLLAGAGLGVGLIKVVWTFLLFRDHPFPDKPPSLLEDLQHLRSHDALVSIPIICCSAVSIGMGGSCGPEAAMGAVGVAVGSTLVAHRNRYLNRLYQWLFCRKSGDEQTQSDTIPDSVVKGEAAEYLFPDLSSEEQLCALDGMAAGFGALFPSQILSPLMLHEIGFLWGANTSHFMETVIRTGISATVGYTLFVGLQELTFLEAVVLPAAAYELLPTIEVKYIGYAAVLGIISGFVGLYGFICLGIGGIAGTKSFKKLNDLGDRLGLPSRFLGLLMTPVIGGTLQGLLAVAAPLTLGDGAHQIGAATILGGELGADDLIVTMFAKLAAVSIALGFGFVGGQIFPLLFSGVCLGSLAHVWVPDVPILVAVPCCMVAVPCAFFPALFTMTIVVSLVLALGGAATSPVFFAAVCSYTTVCGLGVVQDILQKAVEGQASEHGSNDEQETTKEQVKMSAEADQTGGSLNVSGSGTSPET